VIVFLVRSVPIDYEESGTNGIVIVYDGFWVIEVIPRYANNRMMTTRWFCEIWGILLPLTRLSDSDAVNQYHPAIGILCRIEGIIICLR